MNAKSSRYFYAGRTAPLSGPDPNVTYMQMFTLATQIKPTTLAQGPGRGAWGVGRQRMAYTLGKEFDSPTQAPRPRPIFGVPLNDHHSD